MTTNQTSRRSLLGALAAVPAAAVPVIAAAATPEPDPIFGLIEAARRAKAAAEAAAEIASELCKKVEPWAGVEHSMDIVSKLTGRDWGGRWKDRADLEAHFDAWQKLLRIGKRHEAEATRLDAEKAAALAKFDEAKSAYDRKIETSGLVKAENEARDLCIARWNAEEAVLAAKPRTHAGAAALLMFVAEYVADDMNTDMHTIVPAFVNAAAAISGKPITVSKELQEVLDGNRV